MRHSERMEDIRRRLDLAMAERNCVAEGGDAYKVLVEVAKAIREEYKNLKKCGQRNRHGFRCYNGVYRLVVLNDNEMF